jgi:hypothetical protein
MTEPWGSVDDISAQLGVLKDSKSRWSDAKSLPTPEIGKRWKLNLSRVDVCASGGGALELDEPSTRLASPFKKSGGR